MEQSRRSFLTRIATAAGSAVSLTAAARTASAGPSAGSDRPFRRVRTFLEIENQIVGSLVESAGGSLVADVEETLAQDETFFTKHPITPRISPFEITTNINMEVPFWQRVGDNSLPYPGAIQRRDRPN
jgi:hypothetical protein